jgi:LSD1 subclass zinc finger protein
VFDVAVPGSCCAAVGGRYAPPVRVAIGRRPTGEAPVVLRRFQKIVETGQRLQQQAVAMQEQALAMQEQALRHQQGEPGALDPATWLLPPSEFVKRGTCTSCGAPKQLPTVREYLYCDFCGQLTDYDLRRASEAALASPTIQSYATIANQIGPEAERVRTAGDRARYELLQQRLHRAQTELTPWIVPPRAWKDERYREGWIAYSTAVAVAGAFDPTQVGHADRVRSLALRLQWKGGMGLGMLGGMIGTVRRIGAHGLDMAQMTPKVELASFWPLAEAVVAQTEDLLDLIRREGIRELDPDRSSDELARRMTRSALAQGWLKHMEPEDGEQYIEWLGLRHEYQRAQVHGDRRTCGGCGHDITALPGATVVVCDACGRRVDVATPQVVCTGCNAQVCFLDGATHVQCPFCAAELRRV